MMLTRCPACQTVFRLRSEQLRARHGEVRCGHCFNPFNALDHLIAEAVPPQESSGLEGSAPSVSAPTEADVFAAPVSQESAVSPGTEESGGSDHPAPAANPVETPAPNADEAEHPLEVALPGEPAAPPPSSSPDSEWPAPSLLSDLDFDIPDELVASPADRSPPTRNEPRLEEIDFASFFEPDHDILRAPPEEDHLPPPPTNATLSKFPALSIHGDEYEYTPYVRPTAPSHSPTDHYTRVDPADLSRAETRPLPDVIRAERRNSGDLRIEPGFSAHEPELSEPDEVPDTEPAAAPVSTAPQVGNTVATDAKAETSPEPDTEHLDAVYGKPSAASGLQRTLWGLALGLFAGTLAVQSIYLFRLDIARTLPGLRPLLVTACERLGCDMPLPRESALISIDTSDLQSDPGRPGRFVLHATVKNRAEFIQAWPHLELTLTDATDTALARRVFTPAEWVSAARLEAGFAARGDAVVKQAFDVSALSPTGYRVYVFYP